jgi:hypothetical protein
MANRLNQGSDRPILASYRIDSARTAVADFVDLSPLLQLAKVIAACPAQGKTPVLICRRRLVLADEFYMALCESVCAQSGRRVRFDLLPRHRLDGFLPFFRRARHVRRLNTRLVDHGSVNTTIALSRNHSLDDEMTIGFAGINDELPSYAKPIELAA